MRQYREAKNAIPPDAVLLFRMGDFYEIFFDDADKVSAALDLVLTRRAGVPMCGFPYHALDAQLPKLVAANFKVAIAEQMEDPALAQGLVKREVTRIITPGTIMDNALLNPAVNNFLTALIADKDQYALASLDISTGEFKVTASASFDKIISELNRSCARECLVPQKLYNEWQDGSAVPETRQKILYTPLENWVFELSYTQELLQKHFDVSTLDGFGCKDLPLAVRAAGAVLDYASRNLRQDAGHIVKLETYSLNDALELDAISLRNLEIIEPMFAGQKNNTLLSVLDRTVTPMGGRKLRNYLMRPLCDHQKIIERLDAVGQFKDDPMTAAELRELLGAVRDLERITGRINIGSANPKDMVALANSLAMLPGIKTILGYYPVPLLETLLAQTGTFPELCDKITASIEENPPTAVNEGGIFRHGVSELLDELRSAATEGKKWLSQIQQREQERTNIKSLKIKFNQVFGFYIEISKSNLDLVPDDYIRKQTLVNAERFITPELKELESKILGSEEKSKALELQMFQELRSFAQQYTCKIQQTADAVAQIDVLLSLSECARRNRYHRPTICDDDRLIVKGGRHPVLDAQMTGEKFVPNDCLLDGDLNRMMIITGPNMAGKSTYIRQTALLVIMAQMGSYIPADSAEIGLVDRIFTRIGAADDLSRGQSTFMVEMVETANILHHATPKSLVILDEIGRGTSTFDGLSIAWAVAEFLHDDPGCRCRTQFATHYHELTELSQTRRGINNYNVAVREYGDKIIFLRQIVPGSADRSYGIHVAKLAGLPVGVIERANVILELLEESEDGPREAVGRIPREAVKTKRRKQDSADDMIQLKLL